VPLRRRNPLLAILLTTSTVVTVALMWFGVRNLEQASFLEKQQAREQLERGADAFAAGVRGKLAEAGERLSGWISAPNSQAPALDDAVVVSVSEGRLQVAPQGAIPFVPDEVPIQSPDRIFAEAEATEFVGDQLARSAEMYRGLSRNPNPHIRAEALLRLGRVLRKEHKFEDAIETYRLLAQMGGVIVGGLPAELAGLDGERLTHAAAGDAASEQRVAAQIAGFIDSGRWPLTRGSAEFYREAVTRNPKPESWLLAEALTRLWEAEANMHAAAGGVRVIDVEGKPVLAIWRSNGVRSAALVSFADRFLARNVPVDYGYQVTDAASQRIAGAVSVPSEPVARIIGDPQNPWMLRIWSSSPVSAASGASSRLLSVMLAVVIIFLWGTVYFMARAIRREGKVSRLQSDFVAAVSHEFRTPLTTVRQLSEMLEMDQIPSEDRRRKYYRVLAGESRRLQRLVETLLNFGKMEAGAGQYRLEKLEVAELVSRAMREVSGDEHGVASRVRITGAEPRLHLLGDSDALTLALRNLLDNGLKYSPATEPVEVNWHNDEGHVAISVVDHGPGIPKDEHELVFQKFVRGRSAIQASVKGTGLGLAMVRHILTAHGGEVRLKSEPGRGSTFTIVLTEAN
jgi:two-component system, OmpR family, phosphate regulon sensor histidine kinase PhoR